MVMETFDVSAAEQEIREKCDCDEEGTTAEKLAIAAREFGFGQTRCHRLGYDEEAGLAELKKLLEDGLYPIVYLKMTPPFDLHAVVVIGLTEAKVDILDPYLGPRSPTTKQFQEEWTLTRQTIILIQSSSVDMP